MGDRPPARPPARRRNRAAGPGALWEDESPFADAVGEVLRWYHQLTGDADGNSQLPGEGQWGLVAGLFRQGESKTIEFDVTAGSRYRVAGAGEDAANDLDLCIYDDTGREVRCDRMFDAIPLLSFTPDSDGTYRAVLIAKALDRPAHAGLVILHEPE